MPAPQIRKLAACTLAVVLVCAAVLAFTFAGASGPSPRVARAVPEVSRASEPVEAFPLRDVRLLDSPFKHAEQKDLEYLLEMEPDRLLAPYLQEAGLATRADSYGNWESSGLGGHIGGHYLSALSLMYASTGNAKMQERLQYMIGELRQAQQAHGNGYLGGVPGGTAMWKEIEQGNVEADLFALNDKWVPWYNLHKTFAGLRDAYQVGGVDEARTMLVELADWAYALTDGLSDEQMQTMLRAEHGGMNEVLADVAAITGEDKYLELADRFSHRLILDPLERDEDELTGLHANTQIPKVIGYKRVADVARDMGEDRYARWDDAATFFWNTVVNDRTVAIGGNSVREHFHERDDFSGMVNEPEGPETCNTYNMLRLTRMLFQSQADLHYIDYYERALYNHILSSQHPGHGGLVYFTPMRPSHYRKYSKPDQAMWCCVGSGIENHAKYGELIYAHRADSVYVNLFIPSTLSSEEQGAHLTQETNFPEAERTTITVDSSASFALNLRYPRWVQPGELTVAVNGQRQDVSAQPGEYVSLDRAWQAGDEVTLSLPMHTKLERMPDGSDYFAVLRGPIVLAAKTDPFEDEQLDYRADDSRMGHIADGPLCPAPKRPVFVSATGDFADQIQPVAGEPMTFKAPGLIEGVEEELRLVPFYQVHDARYVVYWPHSAPGELATDRSERAEEEQARLALEAQTVDHVAPGEQQPESDHFFKGEGTEAGINAGRHWRHAEGWFSYDLSDPEQEAVTLRITYYGRDADRAFDITMNGVEVATVELDGSRGDTFFTVDYPVPQEAVEKGADDGTLVTKFTAHPGSMAGGIYDVRLLREEDASPGE